MCKDFQLYCLTLEWSAGAILELGLRVGVIPFKVTYRPVLLTILLSFTHKEFRSDFYELYLLYFVQNFV